MALTVEQAAAKMGMKAHREVIAVVETVDGDVVRTHDGQYTLIRTDGTMSFKVGPPVAAVVPAPAEVQVEVVETPAIQVTVEGAEIAPEIAAAAVRPAKRAKVKAAE